MRKHCIRAICILGVLVVLFSCCPLSAFAVDPVSASVIANSFAQAIAAYGASNGVAMTFDVGSTDGIGETVHELWSDFRAGTQDADDYDTLAAALFPNLYYKALSAAGTAAEAYTVGVSITSEYAEEFDNFYNWLLSGPAEMVQVDNQYYEFSQAQIGPNSSPIEVAIVNNSPFTPVPFVSNGSSNSVKYANGFLVSNPYSGAWTLSASYSDVSSATVYVFLYDPIVSGGFYSYEVCLASVSNTYIPQAVMFSSDTYMSVTFSTVRGFDSSSGMYVSYTNGRKNIGPSVNVPVYSTRADGLAALSSDIANPSVDSVGVKAYGDVGIADIPDTADPNYDALNRAKDIPLNIPWDDTMFGDGSDALTGEQAGAIAGEVSGVLVEDQVIPLAEDEAISPQPPGPDDPSSDPDDYLVPGLADIFPFCIPFDIYNFLSALAANPVAPHFTATLDFPEAVGGTQTIDIDFDSPTWNQLAQLLRLLELLAFIIGLALLTRSMFIRG